MADDEQDKEQKTEEPTGKRLEEAFEKGNIPHSREVTSFVMLAMLALVVSWFAPSILYNTKVMLTPFLADAESIPVDQEGLGNVLSDLMVTSVFILAVPLFGAMLAAIIANLMQNGFLFSTEPVMPKLDRISPLSGIKRLFSIRSVMEFVKGLIKIIIVGAVAFVAVYPELVHIKQLPSSSVEAGLMFLGSLAARMTIGVAIAMFFIAILDFLFQRYQYMKSLRMSRQEIKDEYKQSEGDPVIKGRLRRLRMERARKRMMAEVPKADVVITNPTHFAVALIYDNLKMKAPKVVAKGQDLIALKIREVAKEHDVPIVENPPLARALYDSAELDEEIPVTHYEAVAKIISYVYKLKGKKLAG